MIYGVYKYNADRNDGELDNTRRRIVGNKQVIEEVKQRGRKSYDEV